MYTPFSIRFIGCLLVAGICFSTPCQAMNGRDTTIRVNATLVRIQWPPGEMRGAILMLPGWNFSRTKTCENSSFCSKALEKGFVLISPEMGKSLYASRTYPNTRTDWAGYPQLKFITDTLQPLLQKQFGLLKPGRINFIYGISTGSRGGALILEHTGNLYKGAALLSGDYNQVADTADNLMKGFYGSCLRFPDRWKGEDNPAVNSAKIKAQVFLGHGTADAVVPFAQSKYFYECLKKAGVDVTFDAKEKQGHRFEFWDAETDAILALFVTWSKPEQ